MFNHYTIGPYSTPSWTRTNIQGLELLHSSIELSGHIEFFERILGFKPRTFRLEVWHSNQLNYIRMWQTWLDFSQMHLTNISPDWGPAAYYSVLLEYSRHHSYTTDPKLSDRWNLNPRPSEWQSDILTNWTTIAHIYTLIGLSPISLRSLPEYA